jgi:hypothetical protein
VREADSKVLCAISKFLLLVFSPHYYFVVSCRLYMVQLKVLVVVRKDFFILKKSQRHHVTTSPRHHVTTSPRHLNSTLKTQNYLINFLRTAISSKKIPIFYRCFPIAISVFKHTNIILRSVVFTIVK